MLAVGMLHYMALHDYIARLYSIRVYSNICVCGMLEQ